MILHEFSFSVTPFELVTHKLSLLKLYYKLICVKRPHIYLCEKGRNCGKLDFLCFTGNLGGKLTFVVLRT